MNFLFATWHEREDKGEEECEKGIVFNIIICIFNSMLAPETLCFILVYVGLWIKKDLFVWVYGILWEKSVDEKSIRSFMGFLCLSFVFLN